MTTSEAIGELVIRQWIAAHIPNFSGTYRLPSGETYEMRQLPHTLAGKLLYGVLNSQGQEVFRFTFGFDINRKHAPAQQEWIEGHWGPTRTPEGLAYTHTPAIGDLVQADGDGTEWMVSKSLTASNPHNIEIMNTDGKVFSFRAKWDKAVRFKRGQQNIALSLLADSLGAGPVESDVQPTNWVIGGKR